jgi:hypothetical protein
MAGAGRVVGSVPACGAGGAVAASGWWPTPAWRPGGAGRDRVRGHVGLHVAAVAIRVVRTIRSNGPPALLGVDEGPRVGQALPPGPRRAQGPRRAGLVPLRDRLGAHAGVCNWPVSPRTAPQPCACRTRSPCSPTNAGTTSMPSQPAKRPGQLTSPAATPSSRASGTPALPSRRPASPASAKQPCADSAAPLTRRLHRKLDRRQPGPRVPSPSEVCRARRADRPALRRPLNTKMAGAPVLPNRGPGLPWGRGPLRPREAPSAPRRGAPGHRRRRR